MMEIAFTEKICEKFLDHFEYPRLNSNSNFEPLIKNNDLIYKLYTNFLDTGEGAQQFPLSPSS